MVPSPFWRAEADIERFEYPKQKQDELIDYFKLLPSEWEQWNRERYGNDRSLWRPLLKILSSDRASHVPRQRHWDAGNERSLGRPGGRVARHFGNRYGDRCRGNVAHRKRESNGR